MQQNQLIVNLLTQAETRPYKKQWMRFHVRSILCPHSGAYPSLHLTSRDHIVHIVILQTLFQSPRRWRGDIVFWSLWGNDAVARWENRDGSFSQFSHSISGYLFRNKGGFDIDFPSPISGLISVWKAGQRSRKVKGDSMKIIDNMCLLYGTLKWLEG